MDTNPPSKIPNEATRQWAHDLLTPSDSERVETDDARADRRDRATESFLHTLFGQPRRVDALEGTDLQAPDLRSAYTRPKPAPSHEPTQQQIIRDRISNGGELFPGTGAGIQVTDESDSIIQRF